MALEALKNFLKTTPIHDAWKSIGIRSHHGIDLALSSLKTKKSSGIGEFLDLLPLIDWCHEVGFSIIQLLPLNDSGEDPSPYNALSSTALHYIYLSLYALPFLDEAPLLREALKSFHFFNETDKVDYAGVLKEKSAWLKRYYDAVGTRILALASYQAFLKENPWVEEYALYKTLKNSMSFATWQNWPDGLHSPSKNQIKELLHIHKEWVSYYSVLQYLCYEQLKSVKDYANTMPVFIKGDIPILISPDSADVWIHREFFDTSFSVGYPPDIYTTEGQHWGFPAFHWDVIKHSHYSWWKQRLKVGSYYYHLYRLDHVAGFYRLWLIPQGKKPKDGFYKPQEIQEASRCGHEYLSTITASSSMLPIAEDLGHIPKEVAHSLRALGIPGTRVIRWERDYQGDRHFFPYNTYHPLSMTCVSTHDSETLELWWRNAPGEAKDFCLFNQWEYTPLLAKERRLEILKRAHQTSSLFHINLFQEYLALFPELIHTHPEEERINVPGLILPSNWTYRFRPSLEKILAHPRFRCNLETILSHSELQYTIKNLLTP
jgi:4-alpha-glucanotransferase